jgi:predicted site-specific integrase-resolvase
MNHLFGGKEASEKLGVHQRTLMEWDKKGLISVVRTPGNKRLYDVDKFLKEHNLKKDENIDNIEETNERLNICYVRVSTNGQKNDLERQKQILKEKYKDYIFIEDIGSGLNLNKKGIRRIINLAIKGKINKLVIAHKDRLVRFGYELIEDLIKDYSNGEIIILDKEDENKKNPEEDLVHDVLQIMNVYVAKMNGLRRYTKKINII